MQYRGVQRPWGLQGSESRLSHLDMHTHTHITHTRVHTCTYTSTCLHVHAGHRCPTPHGLLTMVTEWPPLSSSSPEGFQASWAGGSSANKGAGPLAWPGVQGTDQPAHACHTPLVSSGPPCLPAQPAWFHLVQLPTDTLAELMRNSPAGPT